MSCGLNWSQGPRTGLLRAWRQEVCGGFPLPSFRAQSWSVPISVSPFPSPTVPLATPPPHFCLDAVCLNSYPRGFYEPLSNTSRFAAATRPGMVRLSSNAPILRIGAQNCLDPETRKCELLTFGVMFFSPGDICGVLYISWYFKAYELFSDQLNNLSVGVASISSQRSGWVGGGCLGQLFPFMDL